MYLASQVDQVSDQTLSTFLIIRNSLTGVLGSELLNISDFIHGVGLGLP